MENIITQTRDLKKWTKEQEIPSYLNNYGKLVKKYMESSLNPD